MYPKRKTQISTLHTLNIVAAGDLALQGAMAAAAMLLVYFAWYSLVAA